MAGNEKRRDEDEKVLRLTRGWLVFALSFLVVFCAVAAKFGQLVERTRGFERLAEGHYTTVRDDIATIRVELMGVRDSIDRKIGELDDRLREDIASVQKGVNALRRDVNDMAVRILSGD